jgi:hypothetical protein
MRFPLEAELATANFAPEQQPARSGNDHQRHQLLPIHAGNITSKTPGANDVLPKKRGLFLLSKSQEVCRPSLERRL